jgi:hypothetical protein
LAQAKQLWWNMERPPLALIACGPSGSLHLVHNLAGVRVEITLSFRRSIFADEKT